MKLENASNSQLHQTIKLVDGEFSKLQALDIISALIDQKINYHKVEGMHYGKATIMPMETILIFVLKSF